MRRLRISFEVEFGRDEPAEEEEAQPQGDVFTSAERRPASTHGTAPIGFGRTEED